LFAKCAGGRQLMEEQAGKSSKFAIAKRTNNKDGTKGTKETKETKGTTAL
jgi:hypothetical protein